MIEILVQGEDPDILHPKEAVESFQALVDGGHFAHTTGRLMTRVPCTGVNAKWKEIRANKPWLT